MNDFRRLAGLSLGALAVTIDKGAKVLGENATLKREEHRTQEPTATRLHRCEQQYDYNSASVFMGDLSPWRHLTARSPGPEVGTTTVHRPLTLDHRHA